jgi:argininosuccinate lyase
VEAILVGLSEILSELDSGSLKPPTDLSEAEDIHSVVESWLSDRIGAVAGKLHTARSRNDQVATDTRLYVRDEIDHLGREISELQNWILKTAPLHLETLLPGLTHTQHAQPVSLAHHLLAYFWMFQRDRERLKDARKRVNQSPLGSAALAGTSWPLDRGGVAEELGFQGVCENSLDAVSDRDFVVEVTAHLALLATHLSRLCEELILWSAPEWGFVELDDSVTTGSSIMPQKKNPDVAELIRGKTAGVVSNVIQALILLKGLPLSYHRDLQEDKARLFESFDTVRASVRLTLLMMEGARFNAKRMKESCAGDFSNATDLADELVRYGLPFRQAHEVVGNVVKFCLAKTKRLEDLTLAELQTFSPLIQESILPKLKHDSVMRARISRGGTGPEAVKFQIERAREALKD